MARQHRIERLARLLLGSGDTPRDDLEHALKRYTKDTGREAPDVLDYLTYEGSEKTQHFLEWYGRKKAALFAELKEIRVLPKGSELVEVGPAQAEFEWRDGQPFLSGVAYTPADAQEDEEFRDFKKRLMRCQACGTQGVVPGFDVPGMLCEREIPGHALRSPVCTRCCTKEDHDHSWREA